MLHTQLRSFHAVAIEGGFTAAARALNVTQPTVTVQVKSLEEYFKVELFHRRGRKVVLTHTGRQLFELTRRILSLEGEAVELLTGVGGFHSGHLKVAAVGPYHVTEMLASFNERCPGIKVSVETGNSQEALQALFEFRADVGVLAHIEDDNRIVAQPFSRHPVVVFVNKTHRFARRKAIRIEELDGEQMVLREVGSTTRLAFEAALRQSGVSIDPVMEIGSREAVWMAVQRRIGIGVVSEIEFVPHPDLRTVRILDAEVFTYAHVVCLAERAESRMIKAFFEVATGLQGSAGM
jgi:aminoethylphosphonate catabolism LysR family transcriptional regulator